VRLTDHRRTEIADGRVRQSVTVSWTGGEHDLWLEGPTDLLGTADDLSGFTTMAMLPAMAAAEDLQVDGAISAQLSHGLGEVAAIWSQWNPRLRRPQITADLVNTGASHRPEANTAAYFSRGVDSLYSAVVTRTEVPSPQRLVFVDGLEPTHSPGVAAAEARLAGAAADAVGLPVDVVATDARSFTDRFRGWGDSHGATLAGMATLLSGGVDTMIVASSYGALVPAPYGSHPLVDTRFSTEAVTVEHDDVLFSRVGKVFALVGSRPDLLPHIKVCFFHDGTDNCGRCPKCLHTMASLFAAGALDQATLFPSTIDLDEVRAVRLAGIEKVANFLEVARTLPAHGFGGELRAAMLHAVRCSVRPTNRQLLGRAVDRLARRPARWGGPWLEPENAVDHGFTVNARSLLVEGTPFGEHGRSAAVPSPATQLRPRGPGNDRGSNG